MKIKKENSVKRAVARIIENVKKQGDRALEFYIRKFDGVRFKPSEFSVPKAEWKKSLHKISPQVRNALGLAKKRIELFHREELKRLAKNWSVNLGGIQAGQIANPISSVGLYVPGGRFTYPSTVLMTVIPAKIAGVKKVVMVTPPKHICNELLSAAWICGVDACFAVGGPHAIAALAFGTQTIPKVNKIVGPGNQYVNEAKRQLFGQAGIEALAGPSEVAVWADRYSDPQKVTLNLLAQAEHDDEAKAFLLTQNPSLVAEVRKRIPAKFTKQVKVIVRKKESEIISCINAIAPEHLLLAIKKPERALKKIQNAGAIFLGLNTPVALGDYVAGPSHVLPTGKSAVFSSGLSVKDFLKWSSVIENRTQGRDKNREAAKTLAETEGFYYHSLSLNP